ncbi:MAG: right-handed parallel beta-helix repeat-containing protein [Planctomycetes bacterium]|nr:right-handed parallel beta-helix repeat-containing protein [Planctomycetota bacterium]
MLTARSLSASLLCLSTWTTLAAPANADVLIVAANSPYSTDFPTIQAAVDAAVDGDTLVVQSGTYSAFAVDGRELAIVAAPGANVVVAGSVRVEHTPVGAVLLLAGLKITGDALAGHGLLAESNSGFVRVQDCTFKGRDGLVQHEYDLHGYGPEGALLEANFAVSFTRCSFVGGVPPYSYDCCDFGYTGGHGLRTELTSLALYDCTSTGGAGSTGGWGGIGGDALHLESGSVFASGTSFTGGNGGKGDDFIYAQGGNGGNGISANAGSSLRRLGTTSVGGIGGGFFGFGATGTPGQALVGTGSVVTLVGAARKLSGPTAVVENSSVVLTVQGQPGDRVYLEKSLDAGFAFVPGWHGVKLFAGWPRLGVAPLAVVPSSGIATFTLHADDLLATESSRIRHTQLYVKSIGGGPYLGAPLDLVVFECGIAGDCNQNGMPDLCDIQNGTSADCNSNGVPDECDIEAGVLPDCNQNGVADACDISSGTSTDCNGDGVPDECDYDCNGNGTPDACDISSGSSADCNANGLPDECDLDCNGNGIPDACDISSGFSLDTNGNGVPDECQSASDVYYVGANVAPNGDGSFARPFDSISKGVAYAIDGNNVVLLDGTYTGAANREVDFGGRQIVVRGLHGPTNAIIDCQSLGRAFLFTHGEQPPFTGLAGLTIRNGSAASSPTFNGNGGAVYTTNSNPTLANCRFENSTSDFGGALRIEGTGSATVKGCDFTQNHANGNGGAIALGSLVAQTANALTLTNCTFSGNSANNGGAILHNGASLTVVDSKFDANSSGYATCVTGYNGTYRFLRTRFTDNVGTSYGALNIAFASSVEFRACRFQGNHGASGSGASACVLVEGNFLSGGIHPDVFVDQCVFDANIGGAGAGLVIGNCQSAKITNSTFTHNHGTFFGGLYFVSTPSVTMFNSIVWNDVGNTAQTIGLYNSALAVANCDIQGGQGAIALTTGSSVLAWGSGNLAADPLFQSEIGADANPLTWADNVLQLGAGSPCSDAGDNGLLQADGADLDGDGNIAEPVPLDLLLFPRRVDDPLAPDVGFGGAPLVDLGPFERQP